MTDRAAPWFKFFPADFMNGVRGLTATEVGLYQMLLCRIYEENGPVEFNPLRLSTYCGMREATFKKTVEHLIALGKLTLSEGMLSNHRAEAEISNRARDLKNSSKAGKASAQKRQQNQRGDATPVQQPFNHTDTDTDTDISKEAEGTREARQSNVQNTHNATPEVITDLLSRLHHALGFGSGRPLPKYWIAPDAAMTVSRWQVDLGLTPDEIVHVARANAAQHGEPANGPRTLNRSMADYAAAKSGPLAGTASRAPDRSVADPLAASFARLEAQGRI